jgi:hypothetical protein
MEMMNENLILTFIRALPEENKTYLKDHANKKEGIFLPISTHEEMS